MAGESDVIGVVGRKSFLRSFSCFAKSTVAMEPEKDEKGEEEVVAVIDAEEVEAAAKEEVKEEVKVQVIVRSCLRKKKEEGEEDAVSLKGRVKWIDSQGKDLVEINEYESSHYAELDDPNCVCVIQ